MIDVYGHHIHEISVALDAHLPGNISLASSWEIVDESLQKSLDLKGEKFKNGEYLVVNEELLRAEKLRPKQTLGYGLEWALYYVRALKVADKVQLKLWPDHCLVEMGKAGEAVKPLNKNGNPVEIGGNNGYFGYNVVKVVSDALDEWARNMKVKQIFKGKQSGKYNDNDVKEICYRDYREYRNIGLSRKTESYSAVQPEVCPAEKNFGIGEVLLDTILLNPLIPFNLFLSLLLLFYLSTKRLQILSR